MTKTLVRSVLPLTKPPLAWSPPISVGEYIAHRVGGVSCRKHVMVSVVLEGEGGVPGKGPEVADRLAALGERHECRRS